MKTVLITGANRGIGFEFVKQLQQRGFEIIATCREPEQADELQAFSQGHSNVVVKKLDVSCDDTIQNLASDLSDTKIDWLINNAGISGAQGVTIGNVKRDNFLKVFEVNCFGPLKLSDALLPSLEKSADPLIICISSRMGSISDNDRGRSYAYRTSKAALNCAMRSFALDVAEKGVNVILLHPGWVKTNMGGYDAPIELKDSVARMLEVINQHKSSSHADVLWRYDGATINW